VRGGEGGLHQSIYSREMKDLQVFAILCAVFAIVCVRRNFAATSCSKRHHLFEVNRQRHFRNYFDREHFEKHFQIWSTVFRGNR
jgi:hypothetical protein